MHLQINSGGLDSFFNGISSFINIGVNTANSNKLISTYQAVINKTNNINGGVGTLSTALGYIEVSKTVEESRKIAVQEVKSKTDNFIQIVIQVDTTVAQIVSGLEETFYKTNPWLRPPVPPSGLERFWDKASDIVGKCWNAIVDFYEEHKKIIDTVLIAAGAVMAIAAVVCSGGMALVPLLTLLGVSATWATGISMAVAGVAGISILGASTLNIIDTWAEIDNPKFNTWQSVLNWTSGISNGLYSIGSIYNSVRGVSSAELKTFKKQKFSSEQIKTAVKQDSSIKGTFKSIKKSGTDDILTKQQKGNLGEMITDKQMRIDGYKRISNKTVTDINKTLGTGIDGVYTNGSKYIISEAKYTTSTKPTKALLGNTKLGMKQMSDRWIEKRLAKSVGKDVMDDILNKGYDKILSRIQGGTRPQIILEVLD